MPCTSCVLDDIRTLHPLHFRSIPCTLSHPLSHIPCTLSHIPCPTSLVLSLSGIPHPSNLRTNDSKRFEGLERRIFQLDSGLPGGVLHCRVGCAVSGQHERHSFRSRAFRCATDFPAASPLPQIRSAHRGGRGKRSQERLVQSAKLH